MIALKVDPSIAMQTLILISVMHERSNGTPFFGKLIVEIKQYGIFLLRPCFDFPLFVLEMFLFDFHANFGPIISLDGYSIMSLTYFFHVIYRRSIYSNLFKVGEQSNMLYRHPIKSSNFIAKSILQKVE